MVTSIGATAKRSKELKKAASCRRRKPPRCPLGARSMLPPVPPTRRLLRASLAQHRIPLHPVEQGLHALGNLEQPCATRPHRAAPCQSEHRVYQRTVEPEGSDPTLLPDCFEASPCEDNRFPRLSSGA